MPETPIVRRSRCGCVHDEDGHCLLVCSAHTEAVEGRVGVRMRTLNGELAFFALAPEEDRPQPPPEESLCGEEEDLVTGGDPDPGPLPGSDGLAAWEAHCRVAGKNRVRAYDEAFSLVQAQLTAWMKVYPEAWAAKAAGGELPSMTEAQKLTLATFGGGFAGFLGELRRVTQDVVRR